MFDTKLQNSDTGLEGNNSGLKSPKNPNSSKSHGGDQGNGKNNNHTKSSKTCTDLQPLQSIPTGPSGLPDHNDTRIKQRVSPSKSLNFNLDNIDESTITSPKFISPRLNNPQHSTNSSYSSSDFIDNDSSLMNYSPKHSRKPSSLSSNRNINMKNLSLNLDDGPNANNSDIGTRKKSLTISIPNDELSTPRSPFVRSGSNSGGGSAGSGSSSTDTYTVLQPSKYQILTSPLTIQSQIVQQGKLPLQLPPASATTSTFNISPTRSDMNSQSQSQSQSQPQSPIKKFPQMLTIRTTLASKDYKFPQPTIMTPTVGSMVTPSVGSPLDSRFLSDLKDVNLSSKVPEELQELSQLNAYPNGPANVLNDCIYLYSEPSVEEINQYDLVINVAKECKDLSSNFNPEKSTGKQYVHIPWNHTSSILKELPRLTSLMKQFDDSDNPSNPKSRKILVHCHCGVSRSACVVVAYYMYKFNLSVNDAYELLKSGTNQHSTNSINKLTYTNGYTIDTCNRICPNMTLIFELMDFHEYLTGTGTK